MKFYFKNESSNLDMLLVIENCIPLQKKQFSTTLPKLLSNLHSWTRSHRQTRFKLQASVWKASFNFEHLLNLFNKIRF